MGTTTSQITSGLIGAVATAEQVQAAVQTQTDIFDKIMAGLDQFLSVAPTVAGAIDPAIGTSSTAMAALLKTIVGAVQEFHEKTVVTAVTSATKGA